MNKNSDSSYVPVKSAVRTMDLFELLSKYSEGLSLKSIAQHLDIPLSSTYNLALTLTDRGYLLRDERTRTYRLGPKFAQIQVSYLANTNLIQTAVPIMKKLQRETEETTSLAVLQGPRVLYMHKLLGQGSMQLIGPHGTSRYAHSNAAGKILLAQLTEIEINTVFPEEHLPQLTPHTISSRTVLKQKLREIRHAEVAYEHEEAIQGVWAMASCIWDQDGFPVAAISIVAPITRLKTKDTTDWHMLIKEAAHEISVRLGYRMPTFSYQHG